MSKNVIEFLEKADIEKRKLVYAITDGYEVIIQDPNDEVNFSLITDLHTITHLLMESYGLEDDSP